MTSTCNSLKLEVWGGANKARVRLFKKHEVQKFLAEDHSIFDLPTDWTPKMLSFAGPRAVLERLLVNHDALQPSDITTIQTYERLSGHHNGDPILRHLIRTRREHLNGMRIWPYNFYKFSECYRLGGCTHPSKMTQAKWAKTPYKRFMDQIVKEPVNRFTFLDLDLCGIFSRKNADSVENLFKNRVVDPTGLVFITHQKGRDVRGGQLFDILHGYLKKSPFIDFKSIPHLNKKEYETYIARYIMVPLYYMCKALEYGYILENTRLIEYRDLNNTSGLAVNMLQYFFRWSDADYVNNADATIRTNLESVMNELYEYHNWID